MENDTTHWICPGWVVRSSVPSVRALWQLPPVNHRPAKGSPGLLGCFSSWLLCIFSKRHLNLNPSCQHFSQFFFFPWDVCGFLAVPVHLSYLFCLSVPLWSWPGTSPVPCKEILGSDEFRSVKFALSSPGNSGFMTLHCACISGMGKKGICVSWLDSSWVSKV